ncbi:hypothetical protein FACS18948_3700 [Clostridia bacterium]|nr:hypothetical protein FACS18948_3700 [Clostridia bacterium]
MLNASISQHLVNVTTAQFLGAFYAPDETVCIQVYPDRKDAVFKGKLQYSPPLGDFAKLRHTLEEHNAASRAIAFIVNKGGFSGSDITQIKSLFVETDHDSFDEQYARIKAFPVEPSIIVQTRRSLHTYWLVDDVSVSEFTDLQKRLVAVFNGDANCVNLNRAMRLPGFNHCKQEPVMVSCTKFSPDLRYSKAQITPHLPELPRSVDATSSQPKQKGLKAVANRCDFIKHCRNNAASLAEHDWYGLITNLAVFEGGEAAIHALSQPYPGYSRAETQDKINHFLASGTKPMTCAVIAEKGFKCPRLMDGSCGCKSPAALCYKPLDLDSLRALLEEQPVTGIVSDDLVLAQGFIKEYLGNVDAVTATALIENELRARFAFKAGAIKPLLYLHRELFKEYKDKKAAADGPRTDIPPWYIETERGGLKFLPDILAAHMAQNVHAFHSAGMFFGYENGVYVMHNDVWAVAQVKAFMMLGYTMMSMINDAIGQWRSLIQKDVSEINADPLTINVRNGLFNVLDDGFRDHTPDYITTVQLNGCYDSSAKCPQFLAFLDSMLPKDDIYIIQEIMGYLLIPLNKAQKSFVFVGAPNAGKSTLLSVIQEVVLGSANVSNVAWQNLSDRFNKAELFGKLANIFADLPNKNLDDGGMFKALTGEDFISAERKGKDPFNFRPYARLLFSCNEIPRNYGDRSEGFYRRLLILRFNNAIPLDQRDPNLREKLAAEQNGILLWALEGLKRLITQSFQFSETQTTQVELKRYRVECNSALSFVEDCCTIDAEAESPREDIFNAYREYSKKNGLMSMSQIKFNRDIESAYPAIQRATDRLGKRRTWRGLRFNDMDF